jgi:hypothetical protein
MTDRTLCTVTEVIRDLELTGVSEARLMDYIRAASQFVEQRLGSFIPLTEARTLDGNGKTSLFVDPLLAVTALTDDGNTLSSSTDYLLYPPGRMWANGPYTRLEIDPDSSRACWTREAAVISVTGRWGMYELTDATGATVANTTAILAAGTSLLVGNGGLISPGMILLIETEQLAVTATGAVTDSTANLAEDLDTSEEYVDVNTGTLVNAGETIRVDTEQMYVVEVNTNTLTVIRGHNGTTKATHTSGADVYVYRTYTVKRGISGTTAADHANGVAISRYRVPDDINWLARQTAALMLRKAQSGFAGKTGDANLGEVYYNQEFPKDVFAMISRNYRITRV